MGTATIAPRSRSRELSVAGRKPMLRGIHHLALVTDDMRMTLDFYVRMLGMPIVHGLRTPSREPFAWERGAALRQYSPLFSGHGRR